MKRKIKTLEVYSIRSRVGRLSSVRDHIFSALALSKSIKLKLFNPFYD